MRLQDLQKRLRQLRRKGKSLQEASDDKKASAVKTLEKYAKTACREFCDNVYNSFPREVRDMIYGHLDPGEVTHIVHENIGWGGMSYFNSDSEAQLHAPWEVVSGHWWEVECVGEHMRREVSEHYYRSVCFDFSQNFDLLARFRVTDQWKLGFIPADIVTNVSVTINCEDYDFDGLEAPTVDNSGWGGDNSGSLSGHRPRHKLLSRLESLFGFKRGTKVRMQFSVGQCRKGSTLEKQQWLCDTVLPFAFPTIQPLHGAGYNICLVLSRADSFGLDYNFTTSPEIVINGSLTYEACKAQFETVSSLQLLIMSVSHLTLIVQGQ